MNLLRISELIVVTGLLGLAAHPVALADETMKYPLAVAVAPTISASAAYGGASTWSQYPPAAPGRCSPRC